MNEQMQRTSFASRHSGGTRFLAMIGALLILGISLYASRQSADALVDDETYFAWSGSTAKGSAAYFRVQGPSVVIEYAPQGGTDHIHTVIRNLKDDYGAGLLKK